MALETVIYPHGQTGNFGYDYVLQEDQIFGGFLEGTHNINHHQESSNVLYSSPSSVMNIKDHRNPKSSPESVGRRKRRRIKSGKNKEELENQRMTHITVERNRRKQMNEYFAVIRSLMPASYVHRVDQASIVGGAINFVKELEQQLQTLQLQKRDTNNGYSPPPPSQQPFGEFFTFPQYSIRHATEERVKNRPLAMAEIEVTMVENHANLKILSKKRKRQLFKMVAGLQCLWLTILHLNVTTFDQMVLYAISFKLEDGCQLSTADEIADAVNCLLCRIEEEVLCS